MLYFARIMLTARNIRLLLAFAIVAALAMLAVVAINRAPSLEPLAPSSPVSAEKQAELTLRGISVNETSDGRTKWTLVAETAQYENERALARLSNASLSTISLDKKIGELVLTAPVAVYHNSTRDIFLSGGVKAIGSNGMEFRTQSIRFSGGKAVLYTSDPVWFSDKEFTVEGVGMEYDVDRASLRLSKNVKATVAPGMRR